MVGTVTAYTFKSTPVIAVLQTLGVQLMTSVACFVVLCGPETYSLTGGHFIRPKTKTLPVSTAGSAGR